MVVKRRGSQMVRSVLRVASLYLQEHSLYSVSIRDCVNSTAIVRLEGIGQIKNPITSS
jgi:hypothetical protein